MWPFSDMPLSAATLVGTVANWLLLASLLGGIISTFVIVKTTDVKEDHWAEARRHSNEEIARANEAAAKANREAAGLRFESSSWPVRRLRAGRPAHTAHARA